MTFDLYANHLCGHRRHRVQRVRCDHGGHPRYDVEDASYYPHHTNLAQHPQRHDLANRPVCGDLSATSHSDLRFVSSGDQGVVGGGDDIVGLGTGGGDGVCVLWRGAGRGAGRGALCCPVLSRNHQWL